MRGASDNLPEASKYIVVEASSNQQAHGAVVPLAAPPPVPTPVRKSYHSLRASLRHLNDEQMTAVSSVLLRKIEANPALLDATSLMSRAALSGNRQAFSMASQRAQEAWKYCEACTSAFYAIVESFQQQAGDGQELTTIAI